MDFKELNHGGIKNVQPQVSVYKYMFQHALAP